MSLIVTLILKIQLLIIFLFESWMAVLGDEYQPIVMIFIVTQ